MTAVEVKMVVRDTGRVTVQKQWGWPMAVREGVMAVTINVVRDTAHFLPNAS